jgi:hypothetical protein
MIVEGDQTGLLVTFAVVVALAIVAFFSWWWR